jgi:SAM-dependent methyltransferase
MTVDQQATCWICGAATRPATGVPVPGLSKCASCHFVFRPVSSDEVGDSHDDAYFDDYSDGRSYLEQEAERRYEAKQRLSWMAVCGVNPPGALLEIGSAAGHFAAAAGEAGWNASGIETNGTVAGYGRTNLGVDVQTGSIEDQSLEDRSYDAVAMWHVLEHIPEPLPTVQRLRAACKSGGHLLLEVPNMSSREAEVMGATWSHWAPHAHVSHFTPPTLRLLLERGGFEVEQIQTVPALVYAPRLATRLMWLAGAIKRERRVISIPHPSRQPLLRACARRPDGT